MAHKIEDRVAESSTTTGTGALTLAGALAGFRAFSSVCSTSDTVPYCIWAVDGSGNATGEWETGIGTYSGASTLTRTTVLSSSNSNAVVTFSAGTKYVTISPLASKLLSFDPNNFVPMPIVTATPAAAATDVLSFFAKKFGGKLSPCYIGPTGVQQIVQDALYDNGGIFYLPNNGTTIGLNYGGVWASGGTVSHPTPATTAPAKVNQMYRTRFANVVTTTNQTLGITNIASGQARFWRGNASGLGGFFFACRFIVELWPAATVRLFVGLTDQTTSPVASDTLAGNCVGLWHDTTEAASVLNIVRRDGTTATKTAITLTGNLAAGQAFDFYMYCPPNGSTIYYRLDDINAGTNLVESSITTNLPTNTAFMGPVAQMSNGTANTTVTTTAIGIARLWAQSDF